MEIVKPSITNKQKEILQLLIQFRFITTKQLQNYFKHALSTRIRTWVKDLKDKGYINMIYDRKTYENSAKPAIYYLSTKAKKLLKKDNDFDVTKLEYIYKESKRSKGFMTHCVTVFDLYLLFRSKQEESESLEFFTKAELTEYEYFPYPLPDAYISVESKEETSRYFLDIFGPYTPIFVLKKRVQMYINYLESEVWEENTHNSTLPHVLFVCPNNRTQNRLYEFIRIKLNDNSVENVSFFLTSIELLRSKTDSNIWQEVKIS